MTQGISLSPFRLEVFVPAHEVDGVGGEVAAVDGERGALEPLEQGKHRIAGAATHLQYSSSLQAKE